MPLRMSTGLPNVIRLRDSLAAEVGGGLVAEHPALAVAGEVDVALAGVADVGDRLGDGDDVVGERALEPALLLLGRAEVDDPGLDAVVAQDRDRAGRRGDVVDVGGEHQRRHEDDVRNGRLVDVVVGEVAAQAVVGALGGDLEGLRLLAGLEAAEAQHLERVLGRAREARRPAS